MRLAAVLILFALLVPALAGAGTGALRGGSSTLERAEQALADGDFARAADLADGAGGPAAARILGEALEAQGDLKGAAKAYARAAEGAEANEWLLKRAESLGAVVDKAAAAPKPTATVRPTEAPTAVPSPTAMPSPTSTPTIQPTQAATAAPTEVPSAVPTQAPTEAPTPPSAGSGQASPTPAVTVDAALEAERQALAKERQALEDEKAALEKKRKAIEAGYSDEGDSSSALPQGGFALIAGLREPKYLSRFSSVYGAPLELGLLTRFYGFNLGLGVFFAGAELDKPPSSVPSCPTCPNKSNKDSVEINDPWVSLGYDIEPWKAAPGQVRPFIPLGVRFDLNYVLVNGETYVGPAVSGFVGLGARWRISRLVGLEFSGGYALHLVGEGIDTENGKTLKEMNGDTIKPDGEGPILRLGLQFFIW